MAENPFSEIAKRTQIAAKIIEQWGEEESATKYWRRRLNEKDPTTGITKIEKHHKNIEELATSAQVSPQTRLEASKFLINLAKGDTDELSDMLKKRPEPLAIQINVNSK